MRWPLLSLGTVLLLSGALACSRPAATSPSYTPGLGEIMTLNQMRHSKL